MKRDQEIARQIGKAEEFVRQLKAEIDAIFTEALAQQAVAHAGLYLAVKNNLSEAIVYLGDAYEVMAHGDPEDYAPLEREAQK